MNTGDKTTNPQQTAADPSPALRADDALVRRGLVASRAQARLLITGGRVMRQPGGEVIDKPSRRIFATDELVVIDPPRFISRGGDKLQHLITQFSLAVRGCHALDIGASTGGFTDCLLQNGAASVTAIDVGHGQLHPAIVSHPAVRSHEGVNARELDGHHLQPERFAVVTADVSFISLEHILEAAWRRVETGGWLGVLIKPQFELGRQILQRTKGVVRDPQQQASARDKILAFARVRLAAACLIGCVSSPIIGGNGNREFLAAWTRSQPNAQ